MNENVIDICKGNLTKRRFLFIDREIDDELARYIIYKLLKMDAANHDDITMFINSDGGRVRAGLAIYDIMNSIKSDVITIGVGRCASMASIILANGARGKRYILPHAEVMMHELSAETCGKVTEMQDDLNHSKILNHKLCKLIAAKTNKSYEQVKRDIRGKDAWMNAKNALNYGFVDKIIDEL